MTLDPVRRETWVRSKLTVDPMRGATAGETSSVDADGGAPVEGGASLSERAERLRMASNSTVLVRGIVDRLDLARFDDGSIGLVLSDYKTGKAPDLKYGPATNRRIMEEKFWQLKVYALLIREMDSAKVKIGTSPTENLDIAGTPLRMLRLMYLTSPDGSGRTLEYDLGRTEKERDASLRTIHEDIVDTWLSLHEDVMTGSPTTFRHCDRPFCDCHVIRPFFKEGSLWNKKES